MLNCFVNLDESVRRHPNEVALVSGDNQLTYTQLRCMVNQCANGLKQRGIKQGDRIVLACPNCIAFPVLYYAILKVGAVVVPINILSVENEIVYYLEQTDAKMLISFQNADQLPLGDYGYQAYRRVDSCSNFILIRDPSNPIMPAEDVDTFAGLMHEQSILCDVTITQADDIAVIIFTSGTTGKPKGAQLTHQNIFTCSLVFKDMANINHKDNQLVVLPLFHCYGQMVQMNAGLLAGSTLYLMPRFVPELAMQIMHDFHITIFCGVPTMYWALLHKVDLSQYDIAKVTKHFRLGIAGGTAMPVELLKAFEKTFGVEILEGYGLSESCACATFNRLDNVRKVGSIGVANWGIRIRIVDQEMQDVATGETGEMIMQGHSTMKGYYNMPEATAAVYEGGWLHTGDLAKCDDQGYYYIVDRLTDMIIRGGYNVYPREIEEVLMQHQDVSLTAVIGIPDMQYGEEVSAYIVLKEGATIKPKALIAWAKERLSSYKYPRVIKFVESLPMNATGKILKSQLRKQAVDSVGINT